MDELFPALDPLIRDKLQDDCSPSSASSKTILFVSHDLDEALKPRQPHRHPRCRPDRPERHRRDILLRPANAYVAEFVRHMNPLNVLRGNSVMRPASALPREAGALVIAPADLRRVDGEGRPVGVTLAGREGRRPPMARLGVTPPGRGAGLHRRPVDLTLRAAIALKSQSDHPILRRPARPPRRAVRRRGNLPSLLQRG
jgi:glycine betaine/proline transport system ATP-binding protein